MRIQKHTLRLRLTRAAVAALLCVGVAGAASAGTVYSWQTEDGTFAYTDDRKRIPARYRSQVQARSMEQLGSYKRFTSSSVNVESDYDKRLQARLGRLRGGGAVAMMTPGPGGAPAEGAFMVRMSGNRDRTTTQMAIPIEEGGNQAPIIVDDIRVRADSTSGDNGSMATRHITVVRQGGRIISVSRPQQNQRRLESPTESSVIR